MGRKKGRQRKQTQATTLRPVDLPEGVNIYDQCERLLRAGETGSLQWVDIEDMVEKVDQTLDHFRVTDEGRSNAGNVLIRFAVLMSVQDKGRRFTVGDDPALQALADMWEYFNRLQ